MSTNKRGALAQPLQKLVLSYLSLISTIGRMLIMSISPEIISLIEEIRGDRTHGASQLARQAVRVLKIASSYILGLGFP